MRCGKQVKIFQGKIMVKINPGVPKIAQTVYFGLIPCAP